MQKQEEPATAQPHEDRDTHHLRAQDRLHVSFLKAEFYRPSVSYWLLSGPMCTADPSFVPFCSHQDCLAIYSDIPVTVSTDQWLVKSRISGSSSVSQHDTLGG